MKFLKKLFNMSYPGIHHVNSIIDDRTQSTQKRVDLGDGRFNYVPCRPHGYASFFHRCKATWMVFTGKADALVWEQQ